MEHGIICNVNCGDKKTDEIFMHSVIEKIVKKHFRDLIVKSIPPVFNFFFSKPEMNVENCFFWGFFRSIFSPQYPSIENYRKSKSIGQKN